MIRARRLMHPPLLTRKVYAAIRSAADAGRVAVECSLDLDRSMTTITVGADHWIWQGERFPIPATCKDRTIYAWTGDAFEPVARFGTSLIKLVPTEWGPPTFEIDGIKMLPTSRISPYADAERKVALIQPRGKVILDTCGGLGYFAACCLQGQSSRVLSYEKNADVIWLRGLNPWSPPEGAGLTLTHGDVVEHIARLERESVDAILHDPPRFRVAGELYAQTFYDQLARVLRRRGKLFHYTGTPNKLTTGRDVPLEIVKRLQRAGLETQVNGDGILARKR